jgi:hypothetical protein
MFAEQGDIRPSLAQPFWTSRVIQSTVSIPATLPFAVLVAWTHRFLQETVERSNYGTIKTEDWLENPNASTGAHVGVASALVGGVASVALTILFGVFYSHMSIEEGR